LIKIKTTFRKQKINFACNIKNFIFSKKEMCTTLNNNTLLNILIIWSYKNKILYVEIESKNKSLS